MIKLPLLPTCSMKGTLLPVLIYCAGIAGSLSQPAHPLQPNIVFVVADDMGAWALGKGGGPNSYTPVLDKMAGAGISLRNCFANGAVCSPSRAALISGRYPSETGVTDIIPQNTAGGLSLELSTLPGVLQAGGYNTALVGKWHLGEYKDAYMPRQRGYGRFTGFPHGGMQSMSPEIMIEDKWHTAEGAYTEDALTDYAMKYMQELDPARTGKPFFLTLHYWAPHANVKFPEGRKPTYKGRSWLPLNPEDTPYWDTLSVKLPDPDFPNLDKPLLERMIREYHASVHSIDRNMGRLISFLESHSLLENTVIIFTSDHGYMLGHNGLWHKGSGWWLTADESDPKGIYGTVRPNLYDNTLRVPAIIYWPGKIFSPVIINETVDFTDWFPTVLEMTGGKPTERLTLRGKSIVPLLHGKTRGWDNDLYAEYKELRTYRTPEWKIVLDFSDNRRHELYNLANDPAEKQNLYHSRDAVAVRQRDLLKSKLLAKMKTINDPLTAKAP